MRRLISVGMRKITLFVIAVMTMLCFVSCGNKENETSKSTVTNRNTEVREEETIYNPLEDERVIWNDKDAIDGGVGNYGKGRIAWHKRLDMILSGEIEVKDDQLIPICVEEKSVRSVERLYTEWVSTLGVKTEYDDIDLEEIEKQVWINCGITEEEWQGKGEYSQTLSDEENIEYQQYLLGLDEQIREERNSLISEEEAEKLLENPRVTSIFYFDGSKFEP